MPGIERTRPQCARGEALSYPLTEREESMLHALPHPIDPKGLNRPRGRVLDGLRQADPHESRLRRRKGDDGASAAPASFCHRRPGCSVGRPLDFVSARESRRSSDRRAPRRDGCARSRSAGATARRRRLELDLGDGLRLRQLHLEPHPRLLRRAGFHVVSVSASFAASALWLALFPAVGEQG